MCMAYAASSACSNLLRLGEGEECTLAGRPEVGVACAHASAPAAAPTSGLEQVCHAASKALRPLLDCAAGDSVRSAGPRVPSDLIGDVLKRMAEKISVRNFGDIGS